MKHHGGTLEIKSSRGRGTSVRLCFPRLLPREG
jgi:signal transduction histidine kinase